MKEEIGGYFGLELSCKNEYYPNLIKLNSGRNCLEYVLQVRNYKKIYIPYYTCEVILEPILKLNIEYEFYHVNSDLDIIFNKQLGQDETLLVNNYFGIKEFNIQEYVQKFKNLIVDNSQAFYSEPFQNVDTFYSPRKFFGVPDGGYLSIDESLKIKLEQDTSYGRMSHLLKRLDVSANFGYEDFKTNDEKLNNQDIKLMSNLTKKILSSIDYEKIKLERERNFLYLHSILKESNEMKIDINYLNGPMVYPYLRSNGNKLRKILVANKIYIATYWPNVTKWCNKNGTEQYLHSNLLALPISSVTIADLKRIISTIKDGE